MTCPVLSCVQSTPKRVESEFAGMTHVPLRRLLGEIGAMGDSSKNASIMIIIEIIPHGVISILIKRNTLKMAAESGEEASREILYRGYDKTKYLVPSHNLQSI